MGLFGFLFGYRDDEDDEEFEVDEWDPDAELDELLDEGPEVHEMSLDCDCVDCYERWRVAVHEAGHVVVCHHYELPFHFVEIYRDHEDPTSREGDGVELDMKSHGGGVEMVEDTDDMHTPEQLGPYMVVLAAGGAAEDAAFGVAIGTASDDEVMSRMQDRPGCPIDADEAREIADEVVAERYDEMIEVAEDLFEHGTLSYTETV